MRSQSLENDQSSPKRAPIKNVRPAAAVARLKASAPSYEPHPGENRLREVHVRAGGA